MQREMDLCSDGSRMVREKCCGKIFPHTLVNGVPDWNQVAGCLKNVEVAISMRRFFKCRIGTIEGVGQDTKVDTCTPVLDRRAKSFGAEFVALCEINERIWDSQPMPTLVDATLHVLCIRINGIKFATPR